MVQNTKVIEKATGPVGVDSAAEALLATVGAAGDILHTRMTVISGYIANNSTLSRSAALQVLADKIKSENGGRTFGLSFSNMSRFALFAEAHERYGITPTGGTVASMADLYEVSPSAFKAITAVKATPANKGGEAFEARATKAIAAATKAAKPGSRSVTAAPFTVGAFEQSVRDLLAKVPSADQAKARKALAKIASEKVATPVAA